MKKAYLYLANGQVLEGQSFGASGTAIGELVFTTSMIGCNKTLTDPTYYGQLVLFTFPSVGNCGLITADFESEGVHAFGCVMRELCDTPSNFRMEGTLGAYLQKADIPGICGAAAAFDEACATIEQNAAYLTPLRDRLIAGLTAIPHTALNGDSARRLPGNVNVCFEGIEGESLLLLLDEKGIAASSGSACTSGSLDPSHVLLALGLPHEVAHGSLRLSVGEYNTDEEMAYIVENVRQVVDYLRSISPVWDELETGVRQHQI